MRYGGPRDTLRPLAAVLGPEAAEDVSGFVLPPQTVFSVTLGANKPLNLHWHQLAEGRAPPMCPAAGGHTSMTTLRCHFAKRLSGRISDVFPSQLDQLLCNTSTSSVARGVGNNTHLPEHTSK